MTGDRPADFTTQLRHVSCASLVDAMGRLHGHRAHLLPLISPDPTRPLFGPAATITFLPARAGLAEPPDFAEPFYLAVGRAVGGLSRRARCSCCPRVATPMHRTPAPPSSRVPRTTGSSVW